ncbi:flagellar export protein FliJ [Alkalihalobacillus sp. CinArs1]|uniref:flagellar export protein FliJ n=1 Tax=Alkalihalobacillus sp. CinArs1 TaxID=2995314 RepID=UPI0022DE5035|nr:flagellar export protein FliJ [Alkalihalobacillus sp. CinArs1]
MYKFPFQRILDMKENEKEQVQLEMAETLKVQSNLEQEIAMLEQKVNSFRETLEKRQFEGLSVTELIEEEAHVSFWDQKLNEKKEALRQLDEQVSGHQENLAEKVREEKTWQSIKEKRREEHNREIKLIEQNELDSFNTVRAYLQLKNG